MTDDLSRLLGPMAQDMMNQIRLYHPSWLPNDAANGFQPLGQPGEIEQGEAGGSYGTYGTPSNGAGQYGTPNTLRTIAAASAALSNGPQYTPLNIGNISQQNGEPFLNANGKPEHVGHGNGRNIDIRPARRDGANAPVTWQDSQYDRAATQRIVDAFRATGQVAGIYFNDPKIQGVTPYDRHDNHMHVVIKP